MLYCVSDIPSRSAPPVKHSHLPSGSTLRCLWSYLNPADQHTSFTLPPCSSAAQLHHPAFTHRSVPSCQVKPSTGALWVVNVKNQIINRFNRNQHKPDEAPPSRIGYLFWGRIISGQGSARTFDWPRREKLLNFLVVVRDRAEQYRETGGLFLFRVHDSLRSGVEACSGCSTLHCFGLSLPPLWPAQLLWSAQLLDSTRLDSTRLTLPRLASPESPHHFRRVDSRLSPAAVPACLPALSRQALNGEWSVLVLSHRSALLTRQSRQSLPAASAAFSVCICSLRPFPPRSTVRNPQSTIIRDCASKMTAPEPHRTSAF
jgi:hypothetical protein